MKNITICDRTIRQLSYTREYSLSFREKIEIAKLLDRLGVDVIELSGIDNTKVDPLLIKSIVTAVRSSCIAVPVAPGEEADKTVNALCETQNYRLQVEAPVSPVRMEYIFHKKETAMREEVLKSVDSCLKYTKEVEFVADDATRSDMAFLCDLLNAVTEKGVKYVTLCEAAGEMIPEEYVRFLEEVKKNVPALENVKLGVCCSDELTMADECTVAAAFHGADEIKAAAYPVDIASLSNISKVIAGRGSSFGVSTQVRTNSIKRTIAQIGRIFTGSRSASSPFDTAVTDYPTDTVLTVHDSKESVMSAAETLGYDLSSDDLDLVYEEFLRITGKKESVGLRELDAIIASTAMQVPPLYKLEGYIVNTGHHITSMVHIKLEVKDEMKEGIALGDGPIDAAFKAIEQITGRHFELDGFQISAVTEGGTAAGEAMVKLRSQGKLYAGRGLSTDIIGASIRAYIIALNKIAYEEEVEA